MATHFKGPVFVERNVCGGLTSTATAAGTSVLDQNANRIQLFTGSTTQTVKMPKAYDSSQPGACQLPVGYEVIVWNTSSGTVTVQDSAAGAIGTVAGSAKKSVVLTDNSSAAGSWIIL